MKTMSLLWLIALLAAFGIVGGTMFLAGMVFARGQRCGESSDELREIEQSLRIDATR